MRPSLESLRTAGDLARRGKTLEAIACLEAALALTRMEKERPSDASLLARTAALHCDCAGLLSRAAAYYEEAVAATGPEPMLQTALADVRWRLGDGDAARACLATAEAMVRSAPDEDVSIVIANLRARWATEGG